MTAILQQLGLDSTFYPQFVVFFVLFLFLGQFFFKPFLRLMEERHRRTVQDRQAAEAMMSSVSERLAQIEARLAQARLEARGDFEKTVAEAKQEEAKILSAAREEAKRVVSETATALDAERARVRAQLELDAEALASAVADKLLVNKA